jgi:hypothetical protein
MLGYIRVFAVGQAWNLPLTRNIGRGLVTMLKGGNGGPCRNMATFISRKPKQRGKRVAVTARRPLKGLTTSRDFFERRMDMTEELDTIFEQDGSFLQIGIKSRRLYWKGELLVTEGRLYFPKWVNAFIIVGAIFTALYAIATVLAYLNIYIN